MTNAEKICYQLDVLLRADAIDEARQLRDLLLSSHSNEACTWRASAHFHATLGDNLAAVADMSKALSIANDEPAHFFSRGRYLFKAGEYQESVEDFTRVLYMSSQLHSSYYVFAALFFRADAYVRLGRYRNARSDIERLPPHFELWTDRLRNCEELLAECEANDS